MSERNKSGEYCKTCPNRSKVGTALARLGLIEVTQACPEPDVIDRYGIITGSGSPPEGYRRVVSVIGEKGSVDYYRGNEQRVNTCPQSPIDIGADEVVTGCDEDLQGRLWIRIGRGERGDVERAAFNLHLDEETPSRPPLEALKEKRTVLRG